MSKPFRQPLYWAWFFVFFWAALSAYTAITGAWAALVIALTGLIAALMVISAIQSRRRKTLYPNRHFDDTLPDSHM